MPTVEDGNPGHDGLTSIRRVNLEWVANAKRNTQSLSASVG